MIVVKTQMKRIPNGCVRCNFYAPHPDGGNMGTGGRVTGNAGAKPGKCLAVVIIVRPGEGKCVNDSYHKGKKSLNNSIVPTYQRPSWCPLADVMEADMEAGIVDFIRKDNEDGTLTINIYSGGEK